MKERPPLYRSVSTVWGAAFFTVMLIGVIVIAVVPGRGQVVGYVFAPPWLIVTWRSWHWGVVVEDCGVKVVGFLLSKRLRWEEIECFDVRPWQREPHHGFAVLKSRRPLPVWGLGSVGLSGEEERRRREVQEPVDRLNEALERWRAAHTQEA